MTKRTKEENFLIGAFKLARAAGDLHAPLQIAACGRNVGVVRFESILPIVKTLLRANFVLRVSADEICLTDHGIALIKRLVAEETL